MDRGVYDRMHEQEDTHWWFRARRDIIRSVIERLGSCGPGSRVLEAGCGTGGNLAMLAGFGDLDAFEFDTAARERASQRIGREVPFGALPDRLPFGTTRYGLIGLFDVLEHVEDDVGSLAALSRRLDTDGRLVVTVPALPWMWSKHDDRHHHFRRYTRRSLERAARQAGLEVERCFYFNTLLLPVAAGLRAFKALLGKDSPDDTLPSPWLNRVLYGVFALERHLVQRVGFPAGLSLCAVLTQPREVGSREPHGGPEAFDRNLAA